MQWLKVNLKFIDATDLISFLISLDIPWTSAWPVESVWTSFGDKNAEVPSFHRNIWCVWGEMGKVVEIYGKKPPLDIGVESGSGCSVQWILYAYSIFWLV
jgi:hypothetical protein